MENQPLKFASQAEASSQLAKKIDSVQGQLPEDQRKQLESQLAAGDERIKTRNESDAAALGSVATQHEIHTDMSGNILNEHDQQELREKGPVGTK
ncbi:MAG TPA: hypothetical protein VIK37_01435 [Candidatus Saccharimonadales bacterium]